ncbi:uncharacterized protein BDZ99DRAFT_559505, partial [Mytilinidion resinicola]
RLEAAGALRGRNRCRRRDASKERVRRTQNLNWRKDWTLEPQAHQTLGCSRQDSSAGQLAIEGCRGGNAVTKESREMVRQISHITCTSPAGWLGRKKIYGPGAAAPERPSPSPVGTRRGPRGVVGVNGSLHSGLNQPSRLEPIRSRTTGPRDPPAQASQACRGETTRVGQLLSVATLLCGDGMGVAAGNWGADAQLRCQHTAHAQLQDSQGAVMMMQELPLTSTPSTRMRQGPGEVLRASRAPGQASSTLRASEIRPKPDRAAGESSWRPGWSSSPITTAEPYGLLASGDALPGPAKIHCINRMCPIPNGCGGRFCDRGVGGARLFLAQHEGPRCAGVVKMAQDRAHDRREAPLGLIARLQPVHDGFPSSRLATPRPPRPSVA